MIPRFFRIQTHEETGSTNVLAKQAAEAGEAEGLVVHARRQTAGKGRRGRVWESPEGNLYVSLLLRPQCKIQEAAAYSFVAALAVYDAVLAICPDASVQLKWPNDVLVDGKKISGILLEAAPVENELIEWLVVGVGINIAAKPEKVLYPTIALSEKAKATTPEDVLPFFLQSFDHWRKTLILDGFGPIRKSWLADARGGSITVKTPLGEVSGEFAGLNSFGALILRLADGSETVIQSGDVFFQQPNG